LPKLLTNIKWLIFWDTVYTTTTKYTKTRKLNVTQTGPS